jgi:hypothetical protein
MSSPQVGDRVTATSGAWYPQFTYQVTSITGSTVILKLWDFYNNQLNPNGHGIQYDTSTGVWSDYNTVRDPHYLTTTSTFAATTSTSAYPTTIYCWEASNLPILLVFNAPTWAQQPSGSGTGTGTGTGTGGTSIGNGDGLITVQSDGTLVFVIYASAPSGQYDIYENDMLIFSYTFTTGTEVSGTSTSYQSEFSEFCMKLGTTLVSLFPARRRKVFCNFW